MWHFQGTLYSKRGNYVANYAFFSLSYMYFKFFTGSHEENHF